MRKNITCTYSLLTLLYLFLLHICYVKAERTCPEISKVKDLTLLNLQGTWYTFYKFPANFSGILSTSDCSGDDHSCFFVRIKQKSSTSGVLEECCSENCKEAPISFNPELAELIIDDGKVHETN